MNSKLTPAAYSIFVHSLELDPMGADLKRYLDEKCGEDQELREEVDELLAAHRQAGEFIEKPIFALSKTTTGFHQDATDTLEGAEPQLVDYKMVRKLGSGGFGDVFLARQTQPLERDVAIKVLKAGIGSDSIVARFRAEQQTLALMDHPHIATVLDASTTDDERPYFVMEFINGVPITEYCNGMQLNVEARLKLFLDVCSAVEHAHQKGIVHRDLKPSNIMVTTQNGVPCVKVIDFGIAKAIDTSSLSDAPSSFLKTAPGMLIGTPQYMSPEQASMGMGRVDTRTDIYSLAAVLYELLTGTPPINFEGSAADLEEVVALIQEGKIQRPSERLRSVSAEIADQRSSTAQSLARLLSTELDWVLVKALEKTPDDRYSTVSGFREDIERFLHHIPVQAAPPSYWYHARKFVRRHRSLAVTSSIILLVAALGFAGTVYGLVEAKESARKATKVNDELVKLAERKKKVVDVFVSAFECTNLKNEGITHDTTAKEILLRAYDYVTEDLGDDSKTKADLLEAIGLSLSGLGESDAAIAALKQVFEIRESATDASSALSTSLHNLGLSYQEAGDPRSSIPHLLRAYILAEAEYGPDDTETLSSLGALAVSLMESGDFRRAGPMLEKVVERKKTALGASDRSTLVAMGNLAKYFNLIGDRKRATSLYDELQQVVWDAFDGTDPGMLTFLNNIASDRKRKGDFDGAITIYESTLRLMKEKLGPNSSLAITCTHGMASAYHAAGDFDNALLLLNEALESAKTSRGEDHRDTHMIRASIALVLMDSGEPRKALPVLQETLIWQQAELGPTHPDTLLTMNNLAGAHLKCGQIERAVQLLEKTIALSEKKLGHSHPDTIARISNLAGAKLDAGDLQSAAILFNRLLEAKLNHQNYNEVDTSLAFLLLQRTQLHAEMYEEAETTVRTWINHLENKLEMRSDLARANTSLAAALSGQGDRDGAIAAAKRALAIREIESTQKSRAIGIAAFEIAKTGKLAATQRLASEFENLAHLLPRIDRRQRWYVSRMCARIIALYNESEQPEEAAKWRLRLKEIACQIEELSLKTDDAPD